ncbi:MAG: hypothetical protein ACREYF_18600 [Gammaproteobacteria bacterium]
MKHAFSPEATRQRSDPQAGSTAVTSYTLAELGSSVRLKKERRGVDLNVFENAYRKGAERAEELCRQVFGGRFSEQQAMSLKTPAAAIRSR